MWATTVLVLSIFTLVVFAIAIVPTLGWINWFNIPVAILGAILSLLILSDRDGQEEKTKAAIWIFVLVVLVGGLRLYIGRGVI